MTKHCMKRLLTMIILTGLFSTGTAYAGTCGGGKITHIKEGGWNTNHFIIRIDYSAEADAVGVKYQTHWIRFLSTMDEKRFNGIKALAYMAFSGNKTVRVWTTSGECRDADDITIYAPGSAYPG